MERARIPRQPSKCNLEDYAGTRREFTWDQAAAEFTWSATGRLNMVHEAIDRWAEGERAQHPALLFCRGERCINYTYRRLRAESCRLANLLRAMGLRPGQHLAVLLPASPEIFLAMAACARLGVVCCCLPPHLTRGQLIHRLGRLQARLILTTPELSQTLPWEHRPPETRVLYTKEPPGGLAPGDLALEGRLPAQSDQCEPVWLEAGHPLFLTFVDEPYGPARAVVHNHGAMSAHLLSARWALDLKDHSVLWCDFDTWGVASAVYAAWAPWLCGVTSLVQTKTDTASFWYRTLEEHKVTTLYTSPERLRRLAAQGDDLPGRYDLSALEHLATVGEPLDAKLFFWTRNHLDLPPHDTWWSADTGVITLANLPCLDIKLASCGKPLPGMNAAVVDPKGRGQTLLTLGRLGLEGNWPGLTPGGMDRTKDGKWLLSGDLALRDEDGFFYIQGRADDLIRVHDETLGPYEMEELLAQGPGVAEAAVIAVPGPEYRPVFKAFVVLAPGQAPSARLHQQLLRFARSRLSPSAPLAALEFCERLPRNGSGRLLRRALRAADLGLPLGDISDME